LARYSGAVFVSAWWEGNNPCKTCGHHGGLVVRVPGYTPRGPGLDFRRCQISCEIVGLERGPLSLVRITAEVLEYSSCSGPENRDKRLWRPVALTTRHPSTSKDWHQLCRRAAAARSIQFACILKAMEFVIFGFCLYKSYHVCITDLDQIDCTFCSE
jgi:hypothetical protein